MSAIDRRSVFDALSRLIKQRDDAEQLCSLTFNRGLDAITGTHKLDTTLLMLLDQAEARGRLATLIAVARQYFYDDERLLAAAENLGLDEGKSKFERCLFADFPPGDVENWRRGMLRCEWAVCRLERAGFDPLGTGCLIGPDLVATSRHVIDELPSLTDLRVRFDFKVDQRGGVAIPGFVVKTSACAPLMADSPADQFDYAVLRLDQEVGHSFAPGPGHRLDPSQDKERRGWIVPMGCDLPPGTPLSIIQHPKGGSMKFAFGAVVGPGYSPGRVEYAVNTEKGSSGAPCFTPDWRLVALHSQYTERGNAGISWGVIIDDLARKGLQLPEAP